jgi:hypothetical protein
MRFKREKYSNATSYSPGRSCRLMISKKKTREENNGAAWELDHPLCAPTFSVFPCALAEEFLE